MQTFLQSNGIQIPLFFMQHEDDKILLNAPDAEWFRILYYLNWSDYQAVGAEYYDKLYEFNKTRPDRCNSEAKKDEMETKDEAKMRILFGRSTMQDANEQKSGILYNGKIIDLKPPKISPEEISPGVVPHRLGGKTPKCFFSMFKSFIGTILMGFPGEPDKVHLLLTSNPSFARVCGFCTKDEYDPYDSRHIPSIRKLEQFDQIMRVYMIWDKIKIEEVKRNIKTGVIKEENELVGDTTHYYACSGFETVNYTDDNGKEHKKSQSKLTKNCRCEDRDTCEHQWKLADDGAGTIVKSSHTMHWGHKASVIGLPQQGIPLDAVAISDASTHDGETLYPHVEKLFNDHPEIKPWIDTIIYDSACDSKPLKDKFQADFDIELKTSFNPRRKKDVTEGLPPGMEKITPYGVPICIAGYEMEYKGIRYDAGKFIYQAPTDDNNITVCLPCEHKINCCPNSNTGRTINISFDVLPQINPDDPPMAKRFKAILSRRTSIERIIKRLKCDLGDDRLSKRGNESFQAYLDKTMIAFHLLLRN